MTGGARPWMNMENCIPPRCQTETTQNPFYEHILWALQGALSNFSCTALYFTSNRSTGLYITHINYFSTQLQNCKTHIRLSLASQNNTNICLTFLQCLDLFWEYKKYEGWIDKDALV